MIRNSKYWNLIGIIIFLNILIPLSFNIINAKASNDSGLHEIKVAIYCDSFSDITLDSRIALQNMFLWMNASVENITATQIQEGKLYDYDIFVLPGRPESQSHFELQDLGIKNLLDYIRNGGAYFGICGGTNFARRIDLFTGTLTAVPGEVIDPHIVEMKVNTLSKEPYLSKLNESFSLLFWGSMYFNLDMNQQYITIASYSSCDKPGMIAYRYGLGSVFLSSPHPEFEENGDKDGNNGFDYLDDEDSEWNLLLSVSQWLVKVPKDNLIFIWIVSINCGALGIGFVLILTKYLVKKRKLQN